MWWVDLGRLSPGASVAAAVAATLGLRDQPGRGHAKALVSYFKHRRALVVFDNCEHLSAGCAELVEPLLAACPGLRLLATSREPVG